MIQSLLSSSNGTPASLSSWGVSVCQAIFFCMKQALSQAQTPGIQEYPGQYWESCPNRLWSVKEYLNGRGWQISCKPYKLQ